MTLSSFDLLKMRHINLHFTLFYMLYPESGSVAQAVPTTDGLTSYAGTTTRHQLTCGEDPPYVVIRE